MARKRRDPQRGRRQDGRRLRMVRTGPESRLFRPPAVAPSTARLPPLPASPADQLIARFKNLSTKDNFPAALPLMAALPGDADLRRAFEALVPANERGRLRKNNPYWQAFTSGKAGLTARRSLPALGLKLT